MSAPAMLVVALAVTCSAAAGARALPDQEGHSSPASASEEQPSRAEPTLEAKPSASASALPKATEALKGGESSEAVVFDSSDAKTAECRQSHLGAPRRAALFRTWSEQAMSGVLKRICPRRDETGAPAHSPRSSAFG
jgi:hypothetical protein